jgi:intein/homing endonuclease
LTEKGLIPIKKLVGKKVKVRTGFNWSNAIGLDRGKCQRSTIKLSSGLTIECDTRHKLKNEYDEWVDFSDLSEGNFVALPKNKKRISASKEMTWAFLFGFILGDGCISASRGRKSLTISVGKTKEKTLKDIYKFLQKQGYGKKGYGTVHYYTKPKTKTKDEKYIVVLENAEFAKFLESKGFIWGWKHNTKRIPSCIWNSSEQDTRDFLDGLWLSDGDRATTAGAGKRLNMSNQKLLEEVQILANRVGYDSHFEGGALRFSWKAFNAKAARKYPAQALLAKAEKPTRRLYNNKIECATDKGCYKKAKDYGKDVSQYVAERILEKQESYVPVYRYDTIESIEVHDVEETTYTMSVDHHLHQFVADGVIHKNTACWVIMRAMIKVQEYLNTLDDWHLVLQVHDEVVLDFPSDCDYKPILRNVRKIMESIGDFISVPLTCSIELHKTHWGESEIIV